MNIVSGNFHFKWWSLHCIFFLFWLAEASMNYLLGWYCGLVNDLSSLSKKTLRGTGNVSSVIPVLSMRQLSPKEGKDTPKVSDGLGGSIRNQQRVGCVHLKNPRVVVRVVHPVSSGGINMCVMLLLLSVPGIQLIVRSDSFLGGSSKSSPVWRQGVFYFK